MFLLAKPSLLTADESTAGAIKACRYTEINVHTRKGSEYNSPSATCYECLAHGSGTTCLGDTAALATAKPAGVGPAGGWQDRPSQALHCSHERQRQQHVERGESRGQALDHRVIRRRDLLRTCTKPLRCTLRTGLE